MLIYPLYASSKGTHAKVFTKTPKAKQHPANRLCDYMLPILSELNNSRSFSPKKEKLDTR